MLSIKHLSVSVADAVIIKDFSLNINPGEIHALMGPNGSGKSTLAYTLAGHPAYQVVKGRVSLNHQQILTATPDERARAGIFLAFQYPVTIEGVSVQNFLKVAHDAIHGKQGSVVDFRQALTKQAKSLGIKSELLSRSLNDGFSGGEKKRVEVLQMLTLKPKIAIFDETDSGLDIDSIKLAAQGVRQAVRQFNTACLVITHYQRILNYLNPDYVHVMIDGRLVTSGGPELVKKLEKSGYKKLTV